MSLADDFTYAQSTSYKYSAGLKLIADQLAKAAGGTFAKAWRAKDASGVFTKLYLRRGNAQHGWLSDALQACPLSRCVLHKCSDRHVGAVARFLLSTAASAGRHG